MTQNEFGVLRHYFEVRGLVAAFQLRLLVTTLRKLRQAAALQTVLLSQTDTKPYHAYERCKGLVEHINLERTLRSGLTASHDSLLRYFFERSRPWSAMVVSVNARGRVGRDYWKFLECSHSSSSARRVHRFSELALPVMCCGN